MDNKRDCKICGKEMTFTIGGFNNYARRGICENCHLTRKTKVCTKCKQEKPREEFFFMAGGRKRMPSCKDCHRKAQKRYKKTPKEKVRKCEKTDADLFNMMNKRW